MTKPETPGDKKLSPADLELVENAVNWRKLLGKFARSGTTDDQGTFRSHVSGSELTEQDLEYLRKQYSTPQGLAELKENAHFYTGLRKNDNGQGR